MSLFGGGLAAAAALRGRVLELLGAEPEWTDGDDDSAVIYWTSGPVTTFFCVEAGPDDAPDLGVLRVMTPVATVGDRDFALGFCNELNLYATTNRWTIAPGHDATEILRVSCSFVVGPHSQAALQGFALWCVREQVAAATAKMTSDVADLVKGKPCLFSGHEGGPYRKAGDWHEVVYHYNRVVTPGKDLPGEALAAELKTALRAVLREMRDDGAAAWYSEDEGTSSPFFTCELPFLWHGYRDDVIVSDAGLPTARVQTLYGAHPHMGNGLLIAMTVPALLPRDGLLGIVNALNLLDSEVPGVTHSVGAWFAKGQEPTYVIYLPAVLADPGQGINAPAVMREILLTLVRQALLARRVLLPEVLLALAPEDESNAVGLGASRVPRGLAWGETGEGRNPAAWQLDRIYELCVGEDTAWACPAVDGFTWWPYQQAQEITVIPRGDAGDVSEIVAIRVATEVRRDVRATPEALMTIARLNAGLSESALVLRDDGTLMLACQVATSSGLARGTPEWVQALAVAQFVTARDLSARLDGLGADAASGHPVSGPRPEPDQLFGLHERNAVPPGPDPGHAAGTVAVLSPQVPLIAAAGQYALPHRMSARDEGGLDFTWHPSHTRWVVPDPAIQVEARPGGDGLGPAWIIRSHVPVTGDEGAKARWCNDRNTELLLGPEPADITVIGGWGLTAGRRCCLTTGVARRLVGDDGFEAARFLGFLLRDDQSAVLAALSAEPGAVRDDPLTAEELAAGLDTVHAIFGQLLGISPGCEWSAVAHDAGVLVTLAGRRDGEPGDGVPADVSRESFETVMDVPVAYNRPQLALVYAALLIHSPNATGWLSMIPLFPDPQVGLALEYLQKQGVIWREDEDGWVFDAGQTRARFEVERVETAGFAGVWSMRVAGVPENSGVDRFEVIIPPAQIAWAGEYTAVEVLAWAGRHVVSQVRHVAKSAERPPASRDPEEPSQFGSGRLAAAALRGRILELLGAEPEWTINDHDSPVMMWRSGPATTFFQVTAGAAGTPDLGVLRVYTPVAWAGNGNAARDVCLDLNANATTVRWSVAREAGDSGEYDEELQLSCAFVVGPHNQAELESFALWCVREQIAIATAHIRDGSVAEAVAGQSSIYTGFPGGDDRADWHEAVSFYERVVLPGAELSSSGLADELQAAFRVLLDAMFEEGSGAWFAGQDDPPLTCEMPFTWDPYPDGVITRMPTSDDDPGEKPPTALVEAEIAEHTDLGNGLRITVYLPRDPAGHAGRAINALNRLDAEVAGSSHSIGGWTMTEKAPGCVIFLPAAFAESVTNLPLVMREILLTLVRQALLARRVLLPPAERSAEDFGSGLGLAVAADRLATFAQGPHGLAWGETGEGRNPAARVLDQIYRTCVFTDSDWADMRGDGFTWWPYQQAQDITATLRAANDARQGVTIRIATEVRRGVPVTDESLLAVAALNAELTQSALVLSDDGRLDLACRLYVHEGTDHWANEWAQMLAAEQFIAARELSERPSSGDLAGFGEPAISGHPFSGPRPEPDELFGIRENVLIGAAGKVRAGLTPIVPLLATGMQYALPHHLSVADEDGGLDFTWHPSQTHADLPVEPAIRVSVRQGDCGSGPGWIIRSYPPVSGDTTVKARWCNDRNAGLLGDGGDDLTVVGGWGLTPDGECCLTTWMSPFFVSDEVELASGLVGNLLSYHQGTVLTTLLAEPGAVTGAPLAPEDLARGLESVLAAFGQVLEYPPDYRWSVKPHSNDVVASLTGTSPGSADGLALAEIDGSAFRTVLRVPVTRNRAELGLLYAAFLSQSVTRIPTPASYHLVPAELHNWDFSWQQVDEALGRLVDEGLIQWDKEERAFLFDAGPAGARLRTERLEMSRLYDASALQISADIPGLGHKSLRTRRANDADVLGSWRHGVAGLSYEVTIPPAGMVWTSDFAVVEMLAWVGRHVIRHVQKAC